LRLALTAFCAAGRGAVTLRACVLRIGTTTTRTSGTSIGAFGLFAVENVRTLIYGIIMIMVIIFHCTIFQK